MFECQEERAYFLFETVYSNIVVTTAVFVPIMFLLF